MSDLEKIHRSRQELGKKNRDAGLRFEFILLAELKKKGGHVIRSAGSHTLIDLVWIHKGKINLINCKKNGVWVSTETKALERLKQETPGAVIWKAYQIMGKKFKLMEV